jgi:hypothetical protein
MSDVLRTAATIAKDSFSPVNLWPGIIVGGVIGVIVLIVGVFIIRSTQVEYKLDSDGCKEDDKGGRIKEPILDSKRKIVGYKECSRPTKGIVKYTILIVVSLILGLIAGSSIYSIMFKIANPKWAAASMAYQSFR